jgi:hypothetical protein
MRTNFAPRFGTIVVAAILTIVGVLGTFTHVIPKVGGYDPVTIGMWCYILATVLLLLGVFFRRI